MKTTTLKAPSSASAHPPSISSRRERRSLASWCSPISSGATAMMPVAPAVAQTRQASIAGTGACSSRFMARAAPAAAAAAPTQAAARKPNTRCRLSSRNGGEAAQRLTSHAVSSASAALHRPKAKAPARLLPASILAATDAATTPVATGTEARRPSAMSAPAATPEAGQNTATPSASLTRARPRRAARKKAQATAAASAAPAATDSHGSDPPDAPRRVSSPTLCSIRAASRPVLPSYCSGMRNASSPEATRPTTASLG